MDGIRGASPTKTPAVNDSPEQLLDVFKAAALSVTKLYKTSAAAQAKSRSDGYQECLEDLLSFLDRRNIGLSDDGGQIRRWVAERYDGKDNYVPTIESEEDEEKNDTNDTISSPEIHRSNSVVPVETEVRPDSAPPPTTTQQSDVASAGSTPTPQFAVPSQDNFTFQTSMSYPQDLRFENLALSDSQNCAQRSAPLHNATNGFRSRSNRGPPRPRNSAHIGRGAGQKRKINIAEIFDFGSIGGKDMFGGNGGGKRSRHT